MTNNKADDKGLRKHMTSVQRNALGNKPTSHANCIAATGVARPGKTARDKFKKTGA